MPSTINSCVDTEHDRKWQGDRMWDELTDSPGSCCSRCSKRAGCTAYSYISGDCLLFSNADRSIPDPGAISGRLHLYRAPPDCRTLGTPCDCPPSTWAAPRAEDLPDRAVACGMLSGRRLFAAGDSLVRDVWTALALWLLVADGVDAVLRAGLRHHAACM